MLMFHFCIWGKWRVARMIRIWWWGRWKKKDCCAIKIRRFLTASQLSFLSKLPHVVYRPSSPVVLSGVNNCLHLVGLNKKREAEVKKRETASITCDQNDFSIFIGLHNTVNANQASLLFCFSFPHFITIWSVCMCKTGSWDLCCIKQYFESFPIQICL